MVTNLPLVNSANLWLVLGPVVAGAAALGAWVARLEQADPAVLRAGPAADQGRQARELPPAA